MTDAQSRNWPAILRNKPAAEASHRAGRRFGAQYSFCDVWLASQIDKRVQLEVRIDRIEKHLGLPAQSRSWASRISPLSYFPPFLRAVNEVVARCGRPHCSNRTCRPSGCTSGIVMSCHDRWSAPCLTSYLNLRHRPLQLSVAVEVTGGADRSPWVSQGRLRPGISRCRKC
jgi:hypothetical protein